MGDYTSREDEEFFGAIGRLTIAWAHLEMGLDCVIEIIHHAAGGNQIEPETPRALRRKIKYLRKFVKRLPIPKTSLKGYENLFEAILSEAENRHDIIHGAVIQQIEKSGEATMIRIMRKDGKNVAREFTVTTNSILKAAREAQKLSGKTLLWATELQRFVQEYIAQRDEQNQS